MIEHAITPRINPSIEALEQLDPIYLGGIKYYGWEIVPTKSVDTGKKDKQSGKEIISQQIDDSGKPKFDKVTALYKRDLALNDQNNKLTQFAMQMQLQLAKSQGGNK